jgi:Holliday junction resolvasome RuvABC DNA-binding subunit
MRTSKAMTAEKVSARAARASKSEPETTKRIFDKVHYALRHLGFRDAEARRAISRVAGMHDSSQPLTLEQALREAIHVATAA